MQNLREKARNVRCLICDVDGVLTDGRVFIDNNGNEFKGFNIQDGLGIKFLQSANIEVAVITGSKQPILDIRFDQLKIKHYYKGALNKKSAYTDLKSRLQLQDHEFAYIGDDVPDLPIMHQVGFSIAVANAVQEVKQYVDWQTEARGGHGGVRQACDFILHSQGLFDQAVELFLNNEQS